MDSKIFKEKSFDRQTEMNVDLVFVTQSRHKQVLNQRIKQLLTQKKLTINDRKKRNKAVSTKCNDAIYLPLLKIKFSANEQFYKALILLTNMERCILRAGPSV